MRLQKQTNNWSCLLTSFAMALDVDQEILIEEIGHDGSEIVWPDLEDPYKRRAFHPQELILCCYNRNVSVTEFNRYTHTLPYENYTPFSIDWSEWFTNVIMKSKCGVLLGRELHGSPHSVAWDGDRIYDPRGILRSFVSFHSDVFYLLSN